MKNLLKAIIGVGAVYGLCRASFMSGLGAGMGVAMKTLVDELGVSVTADELKGKRRPKGLDETIMDLWYNGTIKTMYKEAEG